MSSSSSNLFWQRRLARIAASGLIVLVIIHIIGLWLGGESPPWFNAMFYVRIRTGMAFESALSDTTVGAILAVLALQIAWLLWSKASLVAALLIAPITFWEAYHRFWQLKFILEEGFTVGVPIIVGCASASIAVIVTLLALISAVPRF